MRGVHLKINLYYIKIASYSSSQLAASYIAINTRGNIIVSVIIEMFKCRQTEMYLTYALTVAYFRQ